MSSLLAMGKTWGVMVQGWRVRCSIMLVDLKFKVVHKLLYNEYTPIITLSYAHDQLELSQEQPFI